MRTILAATISIFALLHSASAQTVSVKGKIKDASGYTVALIYPDGSSKSKTLNSGGAFAFSKLKLSSLKGASLQIVGSDGRFFGPIVLGKKGTKVSTSFSGKQKVKSPAINVGKVALLSGYGTAAKTIDPKAFTKPNVLTTDGGRPAGAGNSGIVDPASQSVAATKIGLLADDVRPGADQDLDGIVNALDADDNGNGVLDSADPASEGTDVPYVGLNFDFRRTLNANVRTGLSDSVIDGVVAAENAFSSTFFIALPQDSTIDGGHLICGSALTYCRPNTPLGYSGGVSESSNAFRGPLASLLNSSGYPVLERISVGGMPAVVLSIQPRVGQSEFRPGDVYRVVLTTGGTETSSRLFSLPPYFVSVPALKEYTTNSSTVTVDYSAVTPEIGSIDGVSPGQPIVIGSDGLLTVSFWRPQREPVTESEVGYQDFGGLNYGIIIDSAQATCAGLYTNVSTDLVEDPDALGTGGSPLAQQGANLNPLRDQVADRAVSASNLLSFTVDLKSCLSRSGGAPGVYGITLSAAGSQLTGGRNSANQNLYVQIP